MGVYYAQASIGLCRLDEWGQGDMPWQVHEGTGFGNWRSPEQLREYVQELIAVNQGFQSKVARLQDEKMETVSRLAGGMAHELNNQLMVIYACVDLFLPGLSRGDSLYRVLLKIRNSAQICANLIRQLLLYGCQLPLFKVPTDLNHRVDELGGMLPRLLGENIAIVLEKSSPLWKVNVDTTALDQALFNLVLNARDAMPEGGTLTIKTENVYTVRDRQAGAAPGKFACLSVSDTGDGIDKVSLSRIFEPFFTTKRPDKGIGLGLSVAYGVIQAHDGWIEVESAPGLGSTFKLNIPAV
jgi:signal transduction histidine kinase